MNEQPIDEMMRNVLLQLLQTAGTCQAAGNLAEAERAYRRVEDIAKKEQLADLAERAQSGLAAIERVHTLAKASVALQARDLETAEKNYRAMHKNAPGDAEAARGLAETLFLLGQQDEAADLPVAALERYQEAIRLDPSQQQAAERAKVLSEARNKARRRRLALILLPLVLLATVAVVWAIPWLGGELGRETPPVVPTAAVVAAQMMPPTAIVTAAPTWTPTASALPTWTATVIASPTATASPVRSPSSTATSTASPAPTATNVPPPSATFTSSPSPTNTRPPAPTNTRPPAPTNTQLPAPSATPTVRPSPLPTSPPPLPVITLVEPEDGFSAQGKVTFSWRVDRPLPDGYYYEIVYWPDRPDANPSEATAVVNARYEPRQDTWRDVNLTLAEGSYRWTVLLVKLDPSYNRVTLPMKDHSRVIHVPGGYTQPPGK